MPATRRALLITNPGEEGAENYCKGVFVDAANYRRLFLQSHGGWWQDSEITHLNRPTKNQVRAAIDGLKDHEYSFVAFSGHGWFSSVERATVCTLRTGEEISSLELLRESNKRTLVLDCCRKIYHEPITESIKLARAEARFATRQVADPQRCRDEFFKQVSRASRAAVVIHSCTPSEVAGDDSNFGGRYTGSLIASADRWADEMAERHRLLPETLSIVLAHESAADETRRRSGGTQNPSIDKPRSETYYFPFAVFAS